MALAQGRGLVLYPMYSRCFLAGFFLHFATSPFERRSIGTILIVSGFLKPASNLDRGVGRRSGVQSIIICPGALAHRQSSISSNSWEDSHVEGGVAMYARRKM